MNLAALGLGNLVISLTLNSLGISFNGSLSTLVSQAFGQKEYKLIGLYLNRNLILNVILCLPITLYLYLFGEWTLIKFGVEQALARRACVYIDIVAVTGVFYAFSNCFSRWLAGQREVRYMLVNNIFCLAVHIAIVPYFHSLWGFNGVAYATTLHFMMRVAIVYMMIRCSKMNNYLVSITDPGCY